MNNRFPINRAVEIYSEDGIATLLSRSTKYVYNRGVRKWLPHRVVLYNGVRVQAARCLDSIVPWQDTDRPSYETAIIRAIRDRVERGQKVVVVGGGWGVSTVVAAQQVGESGEVVVFEGAEDWVANLQETLELNEVGGNVSINHAVVSHARSLRGVAGNAMVLSPDDLPYCDVLILDCEGAEKDILEELNTQPSTIVVETHGWLGTSESEVRAALEEKSYEVVERSVADEALRNKCEDRGIYVLVARKD